MGSAVAFVLAATMTAACGSAPPGRMADVGTVPGGVPLTMPVDAGYNAVDVTQVVLLLDRHEQREPLTALMVARSADPETRELARRAAADATETDTAAMDLLEEWGQAGIRSTPASPRLAGADAAAVLTELQGLSGDDFDRVALGLLLQELQRDVVDGAIARNNGRDDDARRLGDETVRRAQQRIDKARSLLEPSG